MGAGIFGVLAVIVLIIGGLVWLLASLAGGVAALATCFVVVCAVMILIILIQKPKGGGLSGAFGGAGGNSQAAFGAKTGDVLTGVTIGSFVLFLGLAMGLVWASQSSGKAPAVDTPAKQTLPVDAELPGEDAGLKTTTNVVDEKSTQTSATDAAAPVGEATDSEKPDAAPDSTSDAPTPATEEATEPKS